MRNGETMPNKVKVWFINQYASLPTTGIGGRHRHLSRELVKLGYDVTLISARFSHLDLDKEQSAEAPERETFEGFTFLRIPVLNYKHAHHKKRVLNWFLFAWRIRRLDSLLNEKPDVIIYSSPSLIPYLSAYRLAKRLNARLVFEVRDIWPLTLRKLGGFSSNNPLVRFMQWIEDFSYKKSDAVISNLEGSVDHMRERGLADEKFAWIPNGYSESELSQDEPADSEILEAIKSQPFSVSYAGSVGEANSLVTMIEAAELLKESKQIQFNILGHGRLLESLKQMAESKGLSNVHFWGSVPKLQVQSFLKASNVCLICWKDSVLYEYGVGANKLFDYLYSSKPIINSYSGGYDIVERYGAGVTVKAEAPRELADTIVELSQESKLNLKLMGERGKMHVSQNHEYSQVAVRLKEVIDKTL